jgi:hypothetical protein
MPNGQGTYSHPHLSGYTGSQQSGQGGGGNSNWGGVASAGLSMLGGIIGAGSQHRRQRELMGLQNQYQQQLNQQGHDLQFDMWNKTNYKAQVEHMKAAGLNPALMYGMSGGGGSTTGSQGGGSAAGGNAAAFNPMDVANLMLLKAQENKLREEGRLAGAKADAVSTYEKGESESRTGVNLAQTRKIEAEYKNIGEDTIKKIQETTNLKTLDEWNKLKHGLDEQIYDRQGKGFIKGDVIGNMFEVLGMDPRGNPEDRKMVTDLLIAWYGASLGEKVANILKAFWKVPIKK